MTGQFKGKIDMHWLRFETLEEFEQVKMALDELADCVDSIQALPEVSVQWKEITRVGDVAFRYARPIDMDATKLLVVEYYDGDWIVYFETVEK